MNMRRCINDRTLASRTAAKRCAILLAVGILLPAERSFAGEDWQYWSTWKASYRLTEDTAVKFLADSYFKDDMSDDYLHDQYLGVAHAIGNGFSALLSIQHVSVQNGAGDWNPAWKAVPGVSYSTEIPNLCTLQLQDRFYYQFDPDSQWDHHRPRISVSRKVGPVKLTLSDELRMDLTGDRERDFYRNRIQAQISKKVTGSMTLGVAYVRQSDRQNGQWESFNVLQTVVGISF
jgi:hypothetical protein